MKTYVRIYENAVVEVISTDRDIAAMFHPALSWVDISATKPKPGVGWIYEDEVFRVPPDPKA